jgi:hypothetical protein
MTDRELLELAAKAAGLRLDQLGGRVVRREADGQPVYWNPITDNGDALRLFCALPWMCIETSDLAATVRERGNPDEPSRVYLMWTEWLDKHNGDPYAATRRAIVRAAAGIGRSKT